MVHRRDEAPPRINLLQAVFDKTQFSLGDWDSVKILGRQESRFFAGYLSPSRARPSTGRNYPTENKTNESALQFLRAGESYMQR
jgi:hypothetical protein